MMSPVPAMPNLLTGPHDCVDRIVMNAYFPAGPRSVRFRTWWRRWHDDGDDSLEDPSDAAGWPVLRRVRGWAQANGVPVIDCGIGDRKHRIAEDYLRDHTVGVGVLLILVRKRQRRCGRWPARRPRLRAATPRWTVDAGRRGRCAGEGLALDLSASLWSR